MRPPRSTVIILSSALLGEIVATPLWAAYLPQPASSANPTRLEEAATAFVQGDYEAAVKKFFPLAQEGLAKAQFALGILYAEGQGVPQDNVPAHMWYDLGAAQGDELARTRRDTIAEAMTPAEISEAQ